MAGVAFCRMQQKMHLNEKFTNLSTHIALFDSNMITNCQGDIYKEFFFSWQLSFLFVCCSLSRWKPTWIFFCFCSPFSSITFWKLMEKKKSIIISLVFSLESLTQKRRCQATKSIFNEGSQKRRSLWEENR